MKRPQTAAGRQNPAGPPAVVGPLVNLEDPRRQFFHDVAGIGLVTLDPAAAFAVESGPGLPVDAVAGKQLQPALLKQILYGPDHAEIFKIVEPAALRREHQARPSGMTVNLESHHPVKMIAVFIYDFSNKLLFKGR